jgi:transposase
MNSVYHTELSSHEGTRCQFNGGNCTIKLGIDVHQDFYVVVMQEGGGNPKPPQRFGKGAFLQWAAKLKSRSAEVHAVYEACGFGFGLQRKLTALGIACQVVCPQKLDERNKRVKTDGLDAKALCLRLDRFVQGNKEALAIVRVPTQEEEQARALHRQREQLVKVRKQLEAQGRSLMVNHGIEPVKSWWKGRNFAALPVPAWVKQLLGNSQPILVALQEKIAALTLQLENAATTEQPRGLGKMTSVVIDREIGDWNRFNNRRQIASYTGLCPGEYTGGTGLEIGPLPAQLQAGREMARDSSQRSTRYRRGAQKSHRSPGSPTRRRSVASAYRPAHSRAIGTGNFKLRSRGTESRCELHGHNRLTKHRNNQPLWNVRRARRLTCSDPNSRASL